MESLIALSSAFDDIFKVLAPAGAIAGAIADLIGIFA